MGHGSCLEIATRHLSKMMLTYSFLLSLLSCLSMAAHNKTEGVRGGKVFSLFSIVQFPNEACTSTSGTYSNGTCFTANECSSNGGSANGNCASGFGVCCVFSISASGSKINQNNSYIVNPSYPSNYAPTSTPSTVTYTINKSSNDICRIRLDYDTFKISVKSDDREYHNPVADSEAVTGRNIGFSLSYYMQTTCLDRPGG